MIHRAIIVVACSTSRGSRLNATDLKEGDMGQALVPTRCSLPYAITTKLTQSSHSIRGSSWVEMGACAKLWLVEIFKMGSKWMKRSILFKPDFQAIVFESINKKMNIRPEPENKKGRRNDFSDFLVKFFLNYPNHSWKALDGALEPHQIHPLF